jgi:hypothetical protein
MSHLAGYLLPALDRPADALTLVREPVDRTISYYHAKQRRRDPAKPMRTLAEIYVRPPDLERRERWEQFSNWQSRALLSVFHDTSSLAPGAGPPPDADLWRRRLRQLVENAFRIGVQDRFEDYVASLAQRYGWQAFAPRSKVNRARPKVSEVEAELCETIRAHNWLDVELYELAVDAQERSR